MHERSEQECLSHPPHLGVIPGALVFVLDEEADGCTERDAVLDTGLELDEILFVTLFISISVCLLPQVRWVLPAWSGCSGQDVCG